MDKEPISSHLDQDMKDLGLMINFINRGCLVIQMEISMKVSTTMGRKQTKEYINMQLMDQSIKENGLGIREVEMAEWNMQMEIFIKVFGKKEKGMEKVLINTIMGINMKGNL